MVSALSVGFGNPADLAVTDRIATEVLEEIKQTAPGEIVHQLDDNIHWIREAGRNHLVVGSQARILYADEEGRSKKPLLSTRPYVAAK